MLTDLSFRVTTSIIINLSAYRTRQDDYLTMKDSQAMLYLASITKKKQNAGIPHCANRLRELQRLSEIPLPDLASGHFDLYESETCDLSKTFNIIEKLWKN